MKDYRSDEAKAYRKLYNTAAWKKRRLAQLTAEPLCCYCDLQGITALAQVADHVIPHRGDLTLFYYGELQSLCHTHHSSVKQVEEQTGVKAVLFDKDGYPVVIGDE